MNKGLKAGKRQTALVNPQRQNVFERRQAMARDPLASVDGFRVLALLVMEHLFGLRVCAQCPDCNLGSSPYTPCQDERGSSTTLMGGVFGRMDAAYVTIEAQKSTGSLHEHCQCFVQCLHQHTALEEIFRLGAIRSWKSSEQAT